VGSNYFEKKKFKVVRAHPQQITWLWLMLCLTCDCQFIHNHDRSIIDASSATTATTATTTVTHTAIDSKLPREFFVLPMIITTGYSHLDDHDGNSSGNNSINSNCSNSSSSSSSTGSRHNTSRASGTPVGNLSHTHCKVFHIPYFSLLFYFTKLIFFRSTQRVVMAMAATAAEAAGQARDATRRAAGTFLYFSFLLFLYTNLFYRSTQRVVTAMAATAEAAAQARDATRLGLLVCFLLFYFILLY
jgi:hypothetical protein